MSASKKSLLVEVTALASNVGSSVLLIYSNKYLMSHKAGLGFSFATSLCAMHYLTCWLYTALMRSFGILQRTSMSRKDLALFAITANISIVSLNLSLMLNPVGYYQISKLCIIPCTCFVEAFWLKRKFTRGVVFSVLMVLAGVSIVTVTDLGVTSNVMGFTVAALSVVSSTMQQILCRTLQQRSDLGFLEFLSHTAAAQGFSLILVGPFIDLWISGKWILHYEATSKSTLAMILSCTVAVAVNMSQYACLGRFQATTFQVLGHVKTLLVLLGGFVLFGDRITLLQVLGITVAVLGMVLYGNYTRLASLPAGKREPGEVALESLKSQDSGEQRIGVSAASQRRGGSRLANNV